MRMRNTTLPDGGIAEMHCVLIRLDKLSAQYGQGTVWTMLFNEAYQGQQANQRCVTKAARNYKQGRLSPIYKSPGLQTLSGKRQRPKACAIGQAWATGYGHPVVAIWLTLCSHTHHQSVLNNPSPIGPAHRDLSSVQEVVQGADSS
jgi:hypothetical protein